MENLRLSRWPALWLLLAVFGLSTFPLVAQDATGRVIGVVTDPSGGVVVKAKITVSNLDTRISRETTTGEDGSYQILLLPIGSYTVEAEAPGFRKVVTSPEKLEINQSLKIDIKLEVGSTTETVQVESAAIGVETVNAGLGMAITSTFINNLPLNGRNSLDLAFLSPGVAPSAASTTTNYFTIAGQRDDSITFLLDGGINNNLLSNRPVLNPNPDMIAEFKVMTSNYNAEYGRNAGGIVSVVTKSGTNTYHGSAYDYLRNNDLNANLFFNNANGLIRPILKRNQFGVTAGGPITIPKVIHGKDKFFFFIGYQGQRQSSLTQTSNVTVFTPAELQGDFSRSNADRSGPDQKVVKFLQQYPYFQPNPTLAAQGIIDPGKINPVATAYIKAGLIPTSASGFLLSQSSAINNQDELTERVDFNVSPNDRIFATLGSSRNPQLTPYPNGINVNGFAVNANSHHYYGSVDYTKSIRPNILNDFRFTAQRNNGLQAVPAISAPKPADLGIPGITPDQPTGPPILSFNSGMLLGFSPQGPTDIIDNTYTWSDTLTWIRNSHTFKTGFNYTPYQDNQIFDFYINGQYSFYGTGGGSFSQNDHADFLMGLPDELYQAPSAPSNIRTHNIGWFFQDEWKLRRNFTLTLGVRYEYSSPKLDTQGRTFTALLGHQSTVFTKAPSGLLFPGDAGAPRGANFPDRNDWAPRLGFAWDPRSNGKMSIRGGFGVFYDILKAEDNFQFNGQPPFFAGADLFFNPLSANPTAPSNYLSQPYQAVGRNNPFPSRPPSPNLDFNAAGFLPFGGSGVYFIDPNLRTPYIFQYNLSVQREISRNTTVEADYVGSDSHKLTGLVDGDPFPLGTSSRLFNQQPGITGTAFSWFDTFSNVGKAYYDGLWLSLNHRPSEVKFLGNVGFNAKYSYGKSVDTESGFRATFSRVPAYNHNLFRSVSDFDTTHNVDFGADWELPIAKAWPGGPSRLTRGWNLRPFFFARSGFPLNVTSRLSRSPTKPGPSGAGDQNLIQANLILPNVAEYDPHIVQKASTGRTGNFFFNPGAFAAVSSTVVPGVFNYGSLGRNAFRGPDRVNFDISLAKTTKLWNESSAMEFRADMFNAFNHAEFLNPNTTITSGTFGQISSTYDPRIVQFALRFQF